MGNGAISLCRRGLGTVGIGGSGAGVGFEVTGGVTGGDASGESGAGATVTVRNARVDSPVLVSVALTVMTLSPRAEKVNLAVAPVASKRPSLSRSQVMVAFPSMSVVALNVTTVPTTGEDGVTEMLTNGALLARTDALGDLTSDGGSVSGGGCLSAGGWVSDGGCLSAGGWVSDGGGLSAGGCVSGGGGFFARGRGVGGGV